MSSSTTGLLVLGNQLFDVSFLTEHKIGPVFLREDIELCTYFKFHKLKIQFFLLAMRKYARELTDAGFAVTYQELDPSERNYESYLSAWIKESGITKICFYEIEDKFFETRIKDCVKATGIECEILPSPMFITSRKNFESYLAKVQRPFLQEFYELQRRRLKILISQEGRPTGGRWSFDEFNRKPLPKDVVPPKVAWSSGDASPDHTEQSLAVRALCEKHFKEHPGIDGTLWLPTSRDGALHWLNEFVKQRLENFGPYEDALTERSDVVFHSALTPFLNTGLLTPALVVKAVLAEARLRKLPIESVEGFIRQ
ncbi:MAG: cryptochrome/photolyase family protein, partial [Proteobacteria bacterium]